MQHSDVQQALTEPEGPQGWGFLKVLPRLLTTPLRQLVALARTHGKVVLFRLKGAELYLVNHPEGVQHLLRTNIDNYSRGSKAGYSRGHILQDLLPLIGNGLFTSDEAYWREQRRLINRAFHPRYDGAVYKAVRQEVDRLLGAWQPPPGGAPRCVDIEAEMKRLMLRILSQTMFSPDAALNEQVMIDHLDTVLQYASIKNNLLRRLWGPAERLGLKPPGQARAQAALSEIDAFAYGLIRACRAGEKAPGQLMQLLLEAEQEGRLTEKQMRDEITTFLFAGFDTTAAALTWTWTLLSLQPEWERKLHAELHEMPGSDPPTLDDLPRLPLSEMVVLEAIRLYPPAWAFFRVSLQEDVVSEHRIPAPSILMVCPYTLHRLPEYWEEPDAYCPERFRTERGVDSFVGYQYAPFGHGPRICVGRRYALLQAHLIVATIAQRYRIQLLDKKLPRITPGIILRATKGVPVQVIPREAVGALVSDFELI